MARFWYCSLLVSDCRWKYGRGVPGQVRPRLFLCNRKGHDRLPVQPCGFFSFGKKRFFQLGPIDLQFGGKNLLFAGSIEAELADADSVLCANGRAEDAAGHGTMGVEIAGA